MARGRSHAGPARQLAAGTGARRGGVKDFWPPGQSSAQVKKVVTL